MKIVLQKANNLSKVEILNSYSHLLGVFLSIPMCLSLFVTSIKYGGLIDIASFTFFGFTNLLMFLMSFYYHASTDIKKKLLFKKMDHISIFLLILGSYAPFTFSLLNTDRSKEIFLILTLLSIIGAIYKLFFVSKLKIISTIIFLLMGWCAVFLAPDIAKFGNRFTVIFLSISGAFYTIGAIFYAGLRFKYTHVVWHIFVLFASIFMYISINFYILQYR